MAKLIKKSSCKTVDGLLMKGKGKLVSPSMDVIWQFRKLDAMVQRLHYLEDQDAFHEMPSLEGFEPIDVDAIKAVRYKIAKPSTPSMDARIAEAKAFMEETQVMHDTAEANVLVGKFVDLLAFCDSDSFVATDMSFENMAVLGDIMKLKAEDVMNYIYRICKSEFKDLVIYGENKTGDCKPVCDCDGD